MRYPTPARWRVQPLEAHDGDTVTVLLDRGMDDQSARAIRLRDVFAPELAQPGGPETRRFVIDWVGSHGDGTDWPFLLETFRTPRSDVDVRTLSRYVGVLSLASGESLNVAVQAFVTARGYDGGVGS